MSLVFIKIATCPLHSLSNHYWPIEKWITCGGYIPTSTVGFSNLTQVLTQTKSLIFCNLNLRLWCVFWTFCFHWSFFWLRFLCWFWRNRGTHTRIQNTLYWPLTHNNRKQGCQLKVVYVQVAVGGRIPLAAVINIAAYFANKLLNFPYLLGEFHVSNSAAVAVSIYSTFKCIIHNSCCCCCFLKIK